MNITSLVEGEVLQGKLLQCSDAYRFVRLDQDLDGRINLATVQAGGWQRLEDMGAIGDSIKVRVLHIDLKKARVHLCPTTSLNKIGSSHDRRQSLKANQRITGYLVNAQPDFGWFVDLGFGVDGVLHISDLEMVGFASLDAVGEFGERVEAVISHLMLEKEPSEIHLTCLKRDKWRLAGVRSRKGRRNSGRDMLIVIDGSNAAHAWDLQNPGAEPLRVLWKEIRTYWPAAEIKTYVDNTLAYLFEAEIESGRIQKTAKGKQADPFVLKAARERNGIVVSKDKFRDRQKDRAGVKLLKPVWMEDRCLLPPNVQVFDTQGAARWEPLK